MKSCRQSFHHCRVCANLWLVILNIHVYFFPSCGRKKYISSLTSFSCLLLQNSISKLHVSVRKTIARYSSYASGYQVLLLICSWHCEFYKFSKYIWPDKNKSSTKIFNIWYSFPAYFCRLPINNKRSHGKILCSKFNNSFRKLSVDR